MSCEFLLLACGKGSPVDKRIAFLGGEVLLEDSGSKRFGTIEELLGLGYSPEGTANSIKEVRLAGMDERGSPFQMVLEFSCLEFGSLPSPKRASTPLGSEEAPAAESSPFELLPSPPLPPDIGTASAAVGMVGPPVVPLGQQGDRVRLGDLLVSIGLLTQEQLAQALAAQKQSAKKERLGIILQRLGFVTPKDLYRALRRQVRL